jgi:hypothetical protein
MREIGGLIEDKIKNYKFYAVKNGNKAGENGAAK